MADIWFADTEHGWVAGSMENRALILATSDGGRHWRAQYRGDESSDRLLQIRFADPSRGWALGYGTIVSTNDGGNSWRVQCQDPKGIGLHDLAAISREEIWAVGGWGFLLHTMDGGATWVRAPVPGSTDDFLWTIAFANAQEGWIAGAKGLILSTQDGGRSWKREHSPLHGFLSDIAVTPSHVFMVASPSQLLAGSR